MIASSNASPRESFTGDPQMGQSSFLVSISCWPFLTCFSLSIPSVSRVTTAGSLWDSSQLPAFVDTLHLVDGKAQNVHYILDVLDLVEG